MMVCAFAHWTKQDEHAYRLPCESERLGISMAEMLRRSLRGMLPVDESKPWMRFAGMVESGDARSSQRIDEIVYGQND